MRALAVLVLVPAVAAADPNVIRDNRLTDLGVTPTLGRGYAPGANTMHSVCFESLPTTEPSFDFDYTFEELESDARGPGGHYQGGEVADFVHANTRSRGRGQHLHFLLATLTVDSYYSSIDEGQARLSASALALLGSGDTLGFFSGCGTHYIRSIGRRSYFLTLFSYATSDDKRDVAFERKLEQAVRKLDPDGVESEHEKEDAAKFSDDARTRDLKIVSKSIGLVAQKTATLIPLDLGAYKESIKEAFKASQSALTGRITSMEVTPWLANPTVLAALALPGPAGGPSRFEKKQVLADNAEFYLALSARLEEVEALVHKAGVCRQELDDHVLDGGAIPAALAGADVVNHRTGARLPLRTLVDELSDAKLAALADVERRFSNGKEGVGIAACIGELERGGLAARYHDQIAACANAPEPSLPGATLIDEFCLPELAPAAAVP